VVGNACDDTIDKSGARRMRPPPALGLVAGAFVWGVIWYPYRLLAASGLTGESATFVTYAIALAIGLVAFPRAWRALALAPWTLFVCGLAAGWTNYAYVAGVLQGEVMRVLLLFYLAPLWTIPFARLILRERTNGLGYAVVFLALAGAVIMLWRPELGVPLARSRAEWFGLSSGIAFALSNVLNRRLNDVPIPSRSLMTWLGVLSVSAAALAYARAPLGEIVSVARSQWLLVAAIGATLFLVNLAVQYGISHTLAMRAIVILLCELVFAAISAWLLAGEVMALREWLGGALIVAASLFSGYVGEAQSPRGTALSAVRSRNAN
jgi:drug/metabolite transporter (DMT)-like permease